MVETVKDFYLIGLTGNLGCGKSTVRRMLEQLGARGIDADLLAHAAMERGTEAWGAIVKAFGPGILRYDGEVDRQSLGKRVFEDPEALSRLEQILHPAVGELVKEILRENKKPVVVLEAIKLIESGLDHWCDALWVVTCSSDAQLERVVRDRQMSPEDARARLGAQSAQDEKIRLASVVIDNGGDTSRTQAQVQKAWAETVHVENARDKSAWLFDNGAPDQPTAVPPPVAEAPTPERALAPSPAPESEATPAPEPAPTDKAAEIPERPRAATPAPEPVPTPPTAPRSEPTPVPTPAPEPLPIAPPTPPPVAAPPPSAEPKSAPPPPTPPITPKPTVQKAAPTPKRTAMPEKAAQIPERPPAPAPQKAPGPPKGLLVQVRPARRSDLDSLSKALARSEGRKEPLPAEETLRRLGERGYRIALAQGRIVAFAAWEAENLVAVTRDIRAESAEIARQALPPLLALIEQDANSLVCEVSVVLVDARTPSIVANLASAAGYQVSDLDGLYKVWRQVISERLKEGEKIWVKPLRKELTTRPIE